MVGTNPSSLMQLNPSANLTGTAMLPVGNVGGGTPTGSPSIGGGSNPFLPTVPGGQQSFPANSPLGGGTAGTTGGAGTGLGGSDLYNLFGGNQNLQGIIKGLKSAGYPGGVASLLSGFLQSGAGFNPQVAQALINAMGPSIERGTENIESQYSAMGERFSSASQIGLADYMSQVNLNIGEIFSQLYEQSVQNYLGILTGAKKKDTGGVLGVLQSIIGAAGEAASGGVFGHL